LIESFAGNLLASRADRDCFIFLVPFSVPKWLTVFVADTSLDWVILCPSLAIGTRFDVQMEIRWQIKRFGFQIRDLIENLNKIVDRHGFAPAKRIE